MSRVFPRLRALAEQSGDSIALEEIVLAERSMRALQFLVGEVEDIVTPDNQGRIKTLRGGVLALLRGRLTDGIAVIEEHNRLPRSCAKGEKP